MLLRYKPDQHEKVIKPLGEGTFSFIRHCQINNTEYAIKYLLIPRIPKWVRKQNKRIPLEISILNELEHINVLRMEFFYHDEFFYKICSLYEERVDLFAFINGGEVTVDLLRGIYKQVLLAVEYIHGKGIVHLDIKDENFLIRDNGHVVMIDFGSARYVEEGPFLEYFGTSLFEPPEILLHMPYFGKEQDMWQVGILFYLVLFKSQPFIVPRDIIDVNVEFLDSEVGGSVDCFVEVIKMVLVKEPGLRKSASYILSTFFNK